ncbi:MAG: hypothetical protein K8L97_28380 [Anaerolineae bacterium]|nr:hypothetical protein [Anaerolineae bacterium]
MSATKSAKQYARMIVDYLKELPDGYSDDPQDVQDALGLTDAEFKLGLDWCVERKIILLEANESTEDITEASKPLQSEWDEPAGVSAGQESAEKSTAEVAVAAVA